MLGEVVSDWSLPPRGSAHTVAGQAPSSCRLLSGDGALPQTPQQNSWAQPSGLSGHMPVPGRWTGSAFHELHGLRRECEVPPNLALF